MNNSITKQDLESIYRAAKTYQDNLCDKSVTFFYQIADNHIRTATVDFLPKNFAHLIGITRNPYSRLSASEIFYKALNSDLDPDHDIVFSHQTGQGRNYFDMKIEVIGSIFSLAHHPLQIGEYNANLFVDLIADKVLGHRNACLAIDLDDQNFFPRAVVNRDIRECVLGNEISPVLASAVSALDEPENIEVTFISKAIDKGNRQFLLQTTIMQFASNVDKVSFTDPSIAKKLFPQSYFVFQQLPNTEEPGLGRIILMTRNETAAVDLFEEKKALFTSGYHTDSGELVDKNSSTAARRIELFRYNGDILTDWPSFSYPKSFDALMKSTQIDDFSYDTYVRDVLGKPTRPASLADIFESKFTESRQNASGDKLSAHHHDSQSR